jgi:transcriptional regulator with XRE-family HTH domain
MENSKDIQVQTTSDFITEMMTDEQTGDEFSREYLKAGFLSSAVRALFYARKEAGLTQAQVAEQLNTKQAAIARLEADTEGSMSLRRYVEAALACGMIPLDITLVPVSVLRDYVIAHPEAPRTQEAYNEWLNNIVQSQSEVPSIQPESNPLAPTAITASTSLDTEPVADFAVNHLKQPSQLLSTGNTTRSISGQQIPVQTSLTTQHASAKGSREKVAA